MRHFQIPEPQIESGKFIGVQSVQNADNNSSSHSKRKLDSHWLMPFSMVLKLGACTYRLQGCKDKLYRTIVHLGRLKPYVEETSKGEAKAPGSSLLGSTPNFASKGSLGILPNNANASLTPVASCPFPWKQIVQGFKIIATHDRTCSKVSVIKTRKLDNLDNGESQFITKFTLIGGIEVFGSRQKFCRFVEHISAVVKSSNKFCSDMEIPCLVKPRRLFGSSVSPFHSDEYLFE
ncbi:hypothetical protein T01_452 [Trichinella spiralis]|uniref:Uncharacterized protein n=1 Tax=Trichinella spiralis TaxID=6334 RepID=A0A0V1BN56_TRISP|nr:hypothetical protein T01_452 [Trichinella spiralis]